MCLNYRGDSNNIDFLKLRPEFNDLLKHSLFSFINKKVSKKAGGKRDNSANPKKARAKAKDSARYSICISKCPDDEGLEEYSLRFIYRKLSPTKFPSENSKIESMSEAKRPKVKTVS